MALVTITNPSIANSETSDVTKLTANDNDLVNGVTDGSKDLSVNAITAAGLITANAGLATGAANDDIYSVAWTDNSSTTKTGWSSTTILQINYKKIGKMVFYQVYITGTSNSTSTSIALAYTCVTGSFDAPIRIVDNGGTDAWGLVDLTSGSTANFYINAAAGGWTASGTKTIIGEFWYEATT